MAKKQQQKSVSDYLNRISETSTPKTVRLPDHLWEQVDDLAELYDVSVNAIVTAAVMKLCDDEASSS